MLVWSATDDEPHYGVMAVDQTCQTTVASCQRQRAQLADYSDTIRDMAMNALFLKGKIRLLLLIADIENL